APAGERRWLYQVVGGLGLVLLVVGLVAARTTQLTTA
ncbi:MAG: hypothetical protein JWN55_2958, partial [Frankiales bacterium]|nr:hypothetical protein [Frankiales bacterium]